MSIELQASVDVDLSGMLEFSEAFNAQWNHQQEGPITKAFRQWAARYRSFIKERYDTYSRGGGDWKPLSDKTIARRRKPAKHNKSKPRSRIAINNRTGKAKVKTGRPSGRKGTEKQAKYWQRGSAKRKAKAALRESTNKTKRKVSILRDTNTMFTAMSPNAIKPGSLELGIVGGMRVGYGGEAKHPTAKITIAGIAAAHQTGAGYLPVRKIIVPPDVKTGEGMTNDMARGIRALGKLDSDQVNEGAT